MPKGEKHRIYSVPFAKVYPYYIAKAERKGRTKAEVDQIIRWLTGYTPKQFETQLAKKTDFERFYGNAPKPNPLRKLIKGVVCGVRVEEIQDPIMRELRYLDKMIDELAKGKSMDGILRVEKSSEQNPAKSNTNARRSRPVEHVRLIGNN